jgi:hypothetical protein
MYVTESHHIVLIKFSDLNRTTSTFVLKLSPPQVATFKKKHVNNTSREASEAREFHLKTKSRDFRVIFDEK